MCPMTALETLELNVTRSKPSVQHIYKKNTEIDYMNVCESA